jgi:hypothetical protein
MRMIINLAGILLTLFGIAVLVYHGFTYTKNQKIAQIGDIKVTANTSKTVYFSPLVGGVSLSAGIVLLLLASAV